MKNIVHTIKNSDDFALLSELADSARVVAVGEDAHFMKEYWNMRQQLFDYFHNKKGLIYSQWNLGFPRAFG